MSKSSRFTVFSLRFSAKVRSLGLWAGAILFAFLLNMTLFGFMPFLLRRLPEKPSGMMYVPEVSIVRVKQKEQPVKQKEIITKNEPKKVIKSEKTLHRSIKPRPSQLPFELNPRLPAIHGVLPVMPMKTVDFTFQGLKNAYNVGELDHPLIPLVQTKPLYPSRAKRMGLEGWVKVKFLVDEKGHVGHVQVLEANPEKTFNRNVIHCVSSWRFSPGEVDGVKVKIWVSTTIKFKLR